MSDLVSQTALIVASQASAQEMDAGDIVDSIRVVHAALMACETGRETQEAFLERLGETPMASIKKDEIICLECGQPFKLLANRHLALHGLTPSQYKAKWRMRKGTPLSCIDLTKKRRAYAKKAEMGWALERYRKVNGIKAKPKAVTTAAKKKHAKKKHA